MAEKTLDIKIFVSHRIDINSELVDNPLYIPVRCGAVFDAENPMNIAGDDTGDNISEKRMSFCEFTVQYWAWKNVEADYYGLCHYRRYLSFADRRFATDEYNVIYNAVLAPSNEQKYGLLNSEAMRKLIEQYDMVVSEYAPVYKIPVEGRKNRTVREMWEAHDNEYFEKQIIDKMFKLIDKLSPTYSRSAREYFSGELHRGFNCYVMKKDLFNELCAFQFPIMFEIDREIDPTGYTQTMLRTPAFVGEMLYGIFVYHVATQKHCKIKEVQLVFFSDTDQITSDKELIKRKMRSIGDWTLRRIFDPFFPKCSKRREKIKDMYYKITGIPRRGKAEIKQLDWGVGSK